MVLQGVLRVASIALAGAVLPVWAAPYPVVRVPHYRVTCQVLSSSAGVSTLLAERSLALEADRAGAADADLPWPGDGPARLRLEALRREGEADDRHRIDLSVRLELPGAEPVRLDRTLDLAEDATALLELYRGAGRAVVLAVHVETDDRWEVSVPSGAGATVVFRVEVERVLGTRTVLLETNELHTLRGQGVEYAFRRGAGDELESLRLRLTPLRVEGDLVELEVELAGTLPAAEGAHALSRRERLLATRGSSTSFEARDEAGGSGYRFRITPAF